MQCMNCGSSTKVNWGNVEVELCEKCFDSPGGKSLIKSDSKPDADVSEPILYGNENTFKFSTIIYIILGLIVPLWIVTLPLFWWFAYQSYKDGSGTPLPSPTEANSNALDTISSPEVVKIYSYDDLEKIKDLMDKGIITEEEFEMEKKKILST